ncbi:hypothetical protein [Nocardia tengchongensis]
MSDDIIAAAPQPDSVLTEEAARELTNTIRARVAQVWELVKQAYAARVWEPLGYGSWDSYCAAEFEGAQLRIPREERSEVVASLREIGMSTRAIAAATGLSQRTVANVAREQNCSPDSVVGLDDKVYRPKPAERQPDTADTSDEQTEPSREPAPVRRRRPIAESFDTARGELLTRLNTLVRLTGDDRFDKHSEQISRRCLGDLLRAREALTQVIDRLSNSSDLPEEG